VNRTLELLRAVLRKCVNEWEWLDRAPYIRMLKEPTRRIRFLTPEEARRLLAELPPHLADRAAFSLATGLRASNVTGLQGELACPERHTALCSAGVGRLGVCRDGAPAAHLAADHLAPYAERLSALAGTSVPVHGTFL
jgi:hypothetical protein